MAPPQPPEPVKLFIAILWSDAAALAQALDLAQAQWGALDFTGPDHPFDQSDFYAPEMGARLQRRLIAFHELVPPESLAEAKLNCNRFEDALAGPSGRRVNLDIGYLDHNKIVLASAKGAGQKIYLNYGIYADLVGRYSGGRYQPFEWTFPDFRAGRYDAELAKLRQLYLEQLRTWRGGVV
jgi:hypothetical protein